METRKKNPSNTRSWSSIFGNSYVEKIDIEKSGQILGSRDDIVKGTVLLDDIYFIKVSPDTIDIAEKEIHHENILKMRLSDVTKLLDNLDKDKNSRSILEGINYLTSGNFISARVDKHAQAHHNLFVRCLQRPEFYIQSILETLHEAISNNKYNDLKNFISMPLRDVLAKGFFELQAIPPDLNKAISAFASMGEAVVENFASTVKLSILASRAPTWSAGLKPTFRETKECYQTSSKAFLKNQKKAIFAAIQAFANDETCQNLLALSIIQLIKEQYTNYQSNEDALKLFLKKMSIDNLDKYLKRGEIRSIPAAITASVNLVISITCGLYAIYFNSALKEELQKELQENEINNIIEANDFEKLKVVFDKDEKKNGLLHRIYLESLRRGDLFKTSDQLSLESIQTRYTSQPITINGNEIIPAKSILMFLPGTVRFNSVLWNNPEEFNPDRFKTNPALPKYSLSVFSHGPRQCPANSISGYLFKSMISYLTLFYDLKLDMGLNKSLDKISVECIPKTPEINTELDYSCKHKSF